MLRAVRWTPDLMPENLPEYFTDGMADAMIGNAFSKLVFTSTTKTARDADTPEERTAVFRVTIPTSVLVEICRNMLGAVALNQAGMVKATADYPKQLAALLDGIAVTPLGAVAIKQHPDERRK